MSSDGGRVGGVRKIYFCYQCDCLIPIRPSPTSDHLQGCPCCYGTFIEECDINPNSLVVGRVSGSNIPIDGITGILFVGPHHHQQEPDRRIRRSGIENLPSGYGTPPASKSVVDELPTIEITNELLVDSNSSSHCVVCQEAFDLGIYAKQMPCHHIYHSKCIIRWLNLHNTCPICRHQLPNPDYPDYEAAIVVSSGSSSSDVGGSVSGSPNSWSLSMVGRLRRLLRRWQFRAFGTRGETSNNSMSRNNNNNNRQPQPDVA